MPAESNANSPGACVLVYALLMPFYILPGSIDRFVFLRRPRV